MDNLRTLGLATEVKIFDPGDPSTLLGGAELLDATVVWREGQWWLYLAGQAHGYGATDIYSASLPSSAPLCTTGWKPTSNEIGELLPAAGRDFSRQ